MGEADGAVTDFDATMVHDPHCNIRGPFERNVYVRLRRCDAYVAVIIAYPFQDAQTTRKLGVHMMMLLFEISELFPSS